MSIWRLAVGNLVSRAPAAPEAVSPAEEDTLLPLVNLGDGYPDQRGGFAWRSDGAYAADLDLNLLATSSEAVHRPTGWADLLLELAGTPGLSESPAEWTTFAGREALAFTRPQVQEVEVMPGETLRLALGLRAPTSSTSATGARVTVTHVDSGLSWEGGSSGGWELGGVAGEAASADAWTDIQEDITWNPAWTERAVYRVVVEPIAAAYDADSLVYASTPALFGAVSLAALVGGNIPEEATVTLTPQPSGTPLTLLPKRRGSYVLAVSEQLAQVWRLEIAMPTGNSPRPNVGELWLGMPVDLDRSPRMDGLGYTEGDPSQVRVRAARNRLEVLSDDGDPAASLKLQFLVPEADYVRVRDGLMRLTRFGKEPALLIPGDDFESDRFYHGRVGEEIAYGRITAADAEEAWRSFTLAFDEDPLAAP